MGQLETSGKNRSQTRNSAPRRGVRLAGVVLLAGSVIGALAACSSSFTRTGGEHTRLSKRVVAQGQPVPKGGGRYKVGKPYQIAGKWFYPREDPTYDRTGIASWYGTLFHGRRTANGEVFDMDALTAAHPTLPLPSLVRVTNLHNGRSIVVRVNDRGPYKHNRIIDMSRYGAHLLGFRKNGTAQVRVTYLRPAPLNGDDSYERMVLARQPWARMAQRSYGYRRLAAAPSSPPARYNHRQSRYMPTSASLSRAPSRSAARHARGNTAPRPSRLRQPARVPLYVQAGIYRFARNAHAVAARLRQSTTVRVDPVMMSGRLYHAVRLGPYLTPAQAQHGVRLSAELGIGDARIITSPYP